MRVVIGAIGGVAVIGGCVLGLYRADCAHAIDARSALTELSKYIPQTPETGERVTQLIADANQRITSWENLPLSQKIFSRLEVDHLVRQASQLINDTNEKTQES